MTMNKVLAIGLSMVMVLGLLASCAKVVPTSPTQTTTAPTTTTTAPLPNVKLGLASNLPVGHPIEKGADRFKELVEQKTAGRIEVTHYPAGSVYGSKDMHDAVSKGLVAIGTFHPGFIAAVAPWLDAFSIGIRVYTHEAH